MKGERVLVLDYLPSGAWSLIEPLFSSRAKGTLNTLISFVEDDCLPAEALFHSQIPTDPVQRWKTIPPIVHTLQTRAKQLGLWNLGLPQGDSGPDGQGEGLTNLEYAVMAEIMGHCLELAPQATNCMAPDSGNMEVLAMYGTPQQKDKYLRPLLQGEIRSSFSMTEFGVASSDATNLHNTIATQSSSTLMLSGHKWWISGAGNPQNRLHIVLAVTHPQNPPHQRHSLLLVDPGQRGVNVVRPMTILGYDDAPEGHCEVIYDNVSLDPDTSVLGGRQGLGRGFEMLQARLGPGRLHHCMRALGVAERALGLTIQRVSDPKKKTFGKQLKDHGTILSDIANSRAEINQARLLVLTAARQIDLLGAKAAKKEIGIAKFIVPNMALRIIDRAMQIHGAEGISQDTPLAYLYAQIRTLKYADGPDEVHIQQVGKQELNRVTELRERHRRVREKEAVTGPRTKAKL
ncbi:acyl-CoA dehydrogenase [Tremella mesenterica]|uniref:Acyl-CoA dehydrogenase n=1 Tax=Tremella mesenterica TaxID=5217 RepID=A0A4V1M3B6_TREME|nr:acyl-CoA dehydrogenase [Tremella mesenterica]